MFPPLSCHSSSSSYLFLWLLRLLLCLFWGVQRTVRAFPCRFVLPLIYFALSLSLLSRMRVSLNEVFNLRRSRCLKSSEWEETACQNLFCVWSLSPPLAWMEIFESDNVSEKMWVGSFYTSCSNSFISCLSNYFFLERDFVLFCYS